ncbi:MAG: T9SS type A sorting domain-containing protein [Candidatus Eisenbacteria bacterium]
MIDDRLRAVGAHPAQVQAVWLKEANKGPTQGFPLYAQMLRDDLRAVLQNLHAKFPNLKLCYMSSRIYAGYASTALNPEPYAYESAFAVRWLIEEQVAGSPALNHDPGAGPVMAPWLAWGPYLWADGLVPRAADGLTWACADFSTNDGTHPATSGRAKVAQMLLDFFVSDPTSEPWFSIANVAAGDRPASAGPLRIAALWPNPARGTLFAHVDASHATTARVEIVTVDGRMARRLPDAALAPGRNVVRWSQEGLPSGVYVLRLREGSRLRAARPFTIIR